MTRKNNDQLTPKEEELMHFLWNNPQMSISKLVELYPEPKPHFNTVATVMRRLEAKGFVGHVADAGTFHYFARVPKESFRDRSFSRLIRSYFGGSYYGAVSALVAEEKISSDELRELLRLVEQKGKTEK